MVGMGCSLKSLKNHIIATHDTDIQQFILLVSFRWSVVDLKFIKHTPPLRNSTLKFVLKFNHEFYLSNLPIKQRQFPNLRSLVSNGATE